jgi:hypothetical protein
MDPLSVTTSIVGLLAAAVNVSRVLTSITSSLKETPRLAHSALSEVNEFRRALESLQTFFLRVSTAPRHRTSLIQLDQLIATLTDAVVTFSDLEALIRPLTASPDSEPALRTRVKLTWEEDRISCLVQRLQQHKSSLSLMLNIVQWYSLFPC